MPSIGPTELLILGVVVALLFGARRLPELGRGLGEGLRELRESVAGAGEGPKAAKEASREVERALSGRTDAR
jgi:sec-independent protein translocase protein TatA